MIFSSFSQLNSAHPPLCQGPGSEPMFELQKSAGFAQKYSLFKCAECWWNIWLECGLAVRVTCYTDHCSWCRDKNHAVKDTMNTGSAGHRENNISDSERQALAPSTTSNNLNIRFSKHQLLRWEQCPAQGLVRDFSSSWANNTPLMSSAWNLSLSIKYYNHNHHQSVIKYLFQSEERSEGWNYFC